MPETMTFDDVNFYDLVMNGTNSKPTPEKRGEFSDVDFYSLVMGGGENYEKAGQDIKGKPFQPAMVETGEISAITTKPMKAPAEGAPGSADFQTIARTAFVDNPETKINIFAEARFPKLPAEERRKRYGIKDGQVVYLADDGKVYREVSDDQFGKMKQFFGEIPAALPAIVGGTVGSLGGPIGAAGGAGVGEGIRKAVGVGLGEPVDALEIAKDVGLESILGLGGEVAGRIPGKIAQKIMARKGARLAKAAGKGVNVKEAAAAKKAAKKWGIDLYSPQTTQAPELIDKFKLLADMPKTANLIRNASKKQQGQIQGAIAQFVDTVGKETTSYESGQALGKASQGAIDTLKRGRARIAKPYYDKAYASGVLVDTAPVAGKIDALLKNYPPTSKSATALKRVKKMLGKIGPKETNQKFGNVFFHGTDADVSVNELTTLQPSVNSTTFGDVDTVRHGIFLSDNQNFAKQYGKNILEVSPNVKRTAKITPALRDEFVDSLDAFKERDLWLLASHMTDDWGMFENEIGERFVRFLKGKGYDSAVFEEFIEDEFEKEFGGKTLVLFDKGQARQPVQNAGNIQYLDNTKKEIDAMVKGLASEGIPGATKRELLKIKKSLTTLTDEASPDYRKARGIFAKISPIVEESQARITGRLAKLEGEAVSTASRRLFSAIDSSPQSVAYAKKLIEKQNPDVWKSATRTYLQDVFEKIKTSAGGGDFANLGGQFYKRTIGDERQKKILRAALGPKGFKGFMDFADILRRTSLTAGKESATATRQIALKDLEGQGKSKLVAMGDFNVTQPFAQISRKMNDLLFGKYQKQLATAMLNPNALKQLGRARAIKDSTKRVKAFSTFLSLAIGGEFAKADLPDMEISPNAFWEKRAGIK
jgi:hypothetical protein